MIKAKKIVIDENGLLSVQREHHSKPHMCVCPFRPGHHYCGEWCPHFSDVRKEKKYDGTGTAFYLNLECGDFVEFKSPEFIRMNGSEESKHDDHHAAKKTESFKNRLQRAEDVP